ncbi:MAG: putative sugar O-methyltransferase [Pseudanabaena sp. ELA607]|jgi:hypothetical protein
MQPSQQDYKICSSASDNSEYPMFCQDAAVNDKTFQNFRRSLIYNQILEHFDYDFGRKCLDFIQFNSPDLIMHFPMFQENDLYGDPVTYGYLEFGNFSPSTLRYIANLSQIIHFFGDLSNMNIIEIGGGYGGLCKIIQDRFKIKSYTIVDLTQVLKLTSRYLQCFGDRYTKNLELRTFEDLNSSTHYDLVISNCAFTECTPNIQDFYLETIIKNSTRGFVIYNLRPESYSPDVLLSKFERLNLKNLSTAEEKPVTCKTNFILLWNNVGHIEKTSQLPYFYRRFFYKNLPIFYPYLLKIFRRLKKLFFKFSLV